MAFRAIKDGLARASTRLPGRRRHGFVTTSLTTTDWFADAQRRWERTLAHQVRAGISADAERLRRELEVELARACDVVEVDGHAVEVVRRAHE